MRTNSASFVLSLGMGLIVLLIGFLALSAAGLVSIGPAGEDVVKQELPSGKGTAYPNGDEILPASYVPATPQEAAAIAAGDALFKNNCAQCHAVNDRVVGPALNGITKRRLLPWIVKWVHNSSKVIASDDEYAVKLFADYGKQQMPAFPQLSGKDIENIVAWVKSQEDNKAWMIDDSGLAQESNTIAN